MFSRLKRLFGGKEREEKLVPVFIPSLASILWHHEQKKGDALTEDEVLAIRGKSVVMMMRASIAERMDERRGYRDINPEFCWLEWCLLRKTLRDEPKA